MLTRDIKILPEEFRSQNRTRDDGEPIHPGAAIDNSARRKTGMFFPIPRVAREDSKSAWNR
jgi:hypothetical protein